MNFLCVVQRCNVFVDNWLVLALSNVAVMNMKAGGSLDETIAISKQCVGIWRLHLPKHAKQLALGQ